MPRSKSRICEICGVREKQRKGFFANFPIDENRCKAWIQVVGNEDLVHLPIEKLHEVRHVCSEHFERKDFNRKGNRLKKSAIPHLNLLAPPLTDDQLKGFPQHLASKQESAVEFENVQPSTSTSQPKSSGAGDLKAKESAVEGEDVWPSTSTSQPKSSGAGDLIAKDVTPKKRKMLQSQTEKQERGCKRKLELETDLTPRKRKLTENLMRTKCTLRSLKTSAQLISKIESPVLKELVSAALKNQKKVKGRRWTTKQKISALAIFKRSPKTYKYLSYLILLPTNKTLLNVLKKIPMETGINKAVIEHLKKIAQDKQEPDKICALSFDEIAIMRRLIYNETTDQVDGFEDFGKSEGSGRTNQVANHALVFMLQGVRAKFKQPIAFYFVKGTVSSQKLASLIRQTISAVSDTTFKVLATICDQGPTNMGGLKILKETSGPSDTENKNFFTTNDGQKVYIIYDIPHLFKSLRNNFLTHGVIQMDNKKGKWCHFQQVEEKNRTLLHLSKITATHVNPKYRAKMRVKYAAQMLSTTVSAVLKLLSENEKNKSHADELMETAKIVEQLDQLFDCTNGPASREDIKKGKRENVSDKTDHLNLWNEFKKKLSKTKFLNKDGKEATNVKCIQGFITSLSSLQDIWHEVQTFGFRYLNLRQLNQDCLENLFGVIRQHSPTNRNPTCASFMAAMKTSIISGMTAPHSRSSNCEKDHQGLLTDFHDLIFSGENQNEDGSHEDNTLQEDQNDTQKDNNDEENRFDTYGQYIDSDEAMLLPVLSLPEEIENIETNLAEIDKQALVYVSGYIASTLKKFNCIDCQKQLTVKEPEDDPIYSYIKLREWWTDKQSLTYPSLSLCRTLDTAVNIFETDVLPRLHERNLCMLCVTLFMTKCDMSWLTCSHTTELSNIIFVRLARLLIRRQCNRINKTFALQEEKLKDANKKAEQS